jgi:hypothetical protein
MQVFINPQKDFLSCVLRILGPAQQLGGKADHPALISKDYGLESFRIPVESTPNQIGNFDGRRRRLNVRQL